MQWIVYEVFLIMLASQMVNVFVLASSILIMYLTCVDILFQASYIPLVHSRQGSSAEDINAMDSLRSILDNAGLPDGECFCFGFKYLNNETNRVSNISPLRQAKILSVKF